ncbi:hypothetical protein B0T16DRAFT_170843 [Cercophora newfieldiana]|uniref:Uncharacterized protein n=1 Tax=Cercophora newfieldiana TaxID=92897 RepID=A0AA39Y711_9PEZI|nr:hypothetical protein B0T16DRAFT_170843 [Cercophora newfieldiana]
MTARPQALAVLAPSQQPLLSSPSSSSHTIVPSSSRKESSVSSCQRPCQLLPYLFVSLPRNLNLRSKIYRTHPRQQRSVHVPRTPLTPNLPLLLLAHHPSTPLVLHHIIPQHRRRGHPEAEYRRRQLQQPQPFRRAAPDALSRLVEECRELGNIHPNCPERGDECADGRDGFFLAGRGGVGGRADGEDAGEDREGVEDREGDGEPTGESGAPVGFAVCDVGVRLHNLRSRKQRWRREIAHPFEQRHGDGQQVAGSRSLWHCPAP